MADQLASVDLMLGQWEVSPRLRALVSTPADRARDSFLPGLAEMLLMTSIDDAQGVWLDFLGRRIGIERPATTDPAQDPRWGFDMAGEPFDSAPFKGDVANDAVFPLPDEPWRRIIRARAQVILSDGTFASTVASLHELDPSATVTDLRDMSVRVATSQRMLVELADDVGAVALPGGVDLVIADRGRFGFDLAGVGFDQGPFG